MDQFNEFLQPKARPRNCHGPCFNATVTIEPFLQGHLPYEIIDIIGLWLWYQTTNFDRPRIRWPVFNEFPDVRFAHGAEFVEIVKHGRNPFIGQWPIEGIHGVLAGGVLVSSRRIGLFAGH